MKPLLYLPVKNPFTPRDFDRMGIAALERHFEVRILDCTAWLMPKAFAARGSTAMALPNLRLIGSLRELKEELKDAPGGFAIDYVGQVSVKAVFLFHLLKARRFKLVVMDSGPVPPPKVAASSASLRSKIAYAIRSNAFQRHANAWLVRLLVKCLPDQTPDYALVSGTSWTDNPRFSAAAVKIPAHSFDYEKYLEVSKLPERRNFPYAVYLDEDISGHEDNIELGLGHPVSARRFYSALTAFFDRFEASAGMPVLVAGYPSQRHARAQQFGGRDFIQGETAQLIRSARIVFAHGSTATSWAVLWRRPIVFLTSDEMSTSWYYPTIEERSRLLARTVVSVDSEHRLPVDEWRAIDEAAYRLYEEKYIKSAGSPNISIWDILLEVMDPASSERLEPVT